MPSMPPWLLDCDRDWATRTDRIQGNYGYSSRQPGIGQRSLTCLCVSYANSNLSFYHSLYVRKNLQKFAPGQNIFRCLWGSRTKGVIGVMWSA